MKNDYYFDSMGNRIRLDTRHLEWCNQNKPGVYTAKKKESARENKVKIIVAFLKVLACGFCGWFAFTHIGILTKYFLQMLECFGVVACIAYISVVVSDLFSKDE